MLWHKTLKAVTIANNGSSHYLLNILFGYVLIGLARNKKGLTTISVLNQCLFNVGPASQSMYQYKINIATIVSYLFRNHTSIIYPLTRWNLWALITNIIVNIFFLTLLLTHFQDWTSHQKVQVHCQDHCNYITALFVRIRPQSQEHISLSNYMESPSEWRVSSINFTLKSPLVILIPHCLLVSGYPNLICHVRT